MFKTIVLRSRNAQNHLFKITNKKGALRNTRLATETNINLINDPSPITHIQSEKDWLAGNPLYTLENSLQLDKTRESLSAYRQIRANGNEMVNQIDSKFFLLLLSKMAQGHCGFLSGASLFKEAIAIREDYLKTNRPPNVEMDALVIKCARFNSLEYVANVFDLVNNMLTGKSPTECLPILNALLELITQYQAPDVAKELFDYMASIKFDHKESFLLLLKAYSHSNRVQEAESLYNRLIDGGFRVDHNYHLALLEGFASNGDIVKSTKYFDKILSSDPVNVQVAAFAAMIKSYASRGLPGDAERLYREMRRKELSATASVYEGLIAAQFLGKDLTKATRWFYKKENVQSFHPSMGMYGELIKIQLHASEPLKAWKTLKESIDSFRKLKSHGSKFYVPSQISRPLVTDLKDKHIDYLRDHLTFADIPTKYRGVILGKLMSTAVEREDKDAKMTLELYNEFTDANGCAFGEQVPLSAHWSAMIAHAVNKNIDGSKEIYDAIIGTSVSGETDTMIKLVQCYSLVGKKVEAFELYENMKSNGLKPTVNVFESLLSISTPEEQLSLLKDIHETGVLVNSIEYPMVFNLLKEHKHGLLPKALVSNLKRLSKSE
ncbi:hypothetical protein BC833DRAFT_618551 [Globomyces pollinis-pini]|nr:hypothetical protein BC833DRAFT_618551 [Globomyces pollinis-pini]